MWCLNFCRGKQQLTFLITMARASVFSLNFKMKFDVTKELDDRLVNVKC